jgi:uncharacterized protein YgiM (DUF1202 family)
MAHLLRLVELKGRSDYKLMKLVFPLFIFFIFVNEPVFAQARFPFIAEVNTDRVHIRAGQHNNFESLAVLSKGDRVTVLSKSYSWYQVALTPGAKAFVKADHVKVITSGLAEVLAHRLNVRAAQSTEASIIGQLQQGQKFFVKETINDWVWLQPVNGISGWVQESFLVYSKIGALDTGIDPNDAAAQREDELRKKRLRDEAKIALLTKAADGQVHCEGNLRKELGTPPIYQVMRNEVVVCMIEGPKAAMDPFVNSRVNVTGRIKSIPEEADAAIVSILRIKLAL